MFSFITNFLEPFAYLLYFLVLLLNYQRKREKALLVLLIYYATATLIVFAGSVAVNITDNNMIVYDLMGLFTTVLLGIYFYQLLQARSKKNLVLALITMYVLYAAIRNLSFEGQRLFDSIGYAIISATVTAYVFMYFHQLLKNVSEVNIMSKFDFWLASGYLIYFAGSFIIFVTYYYFTTQALDIYVKEERALLTALWGVHNILLFISALSLLIGSLWATYRNKLA